MGSLIALGFAAPASVVVSAAVVDVTTSATVAGVAYLMKQAAEHSECPPHSPTQDDADFPLPGFLRDARYDNTVNIGIFGPSGAGKSTLINTLRGARPGDPDFARVGALETTLHPTMYNYREVSAARLWDIPGAGTERFPVQTYIRDMGLRFFDVVVLVTASRVTDIDHIILDGLLQFKVPCFVVRSKIDVDIRNELDDHGRDEQTTKRSVHQEVTKNLAGVVDIYFASKKPYEHDLPRLRQNLMAFVCANRRQLSETDCPICWQLFTIRAGDVNELVTCGTCKSRLCRSCVDDLRNPLTGSVPCPFCCGRFCGAERRSSQQLVRAELSPLEEFVAVDATPPSQADASRCISEENEDAAFSAAFSAGTLVEVHGLTGAVHLNGKRGVLNGRMQGDRTGVDLPLPDGTKAFRLENLRPVEDSNYPRSQARDTEFGLHSAY